MSEIDTELLEERRLALEPRRFSSLRLQVSSVTELGDSVNSVLEVGPGSGYFTSLAKGLGYRVKTADIKSRNSPDYLGDFRDLDIQEQFDLVAAFEMLQHLPYNEFGTTLEKLAGLSNRYVLISVPARVHRFELSVVVPPVLAPRRMGLNWLRGRHSMSLCWEWPRGRDPSESNWEGRADYWNPHYWEVGRTSYPRSRIIDDMRASGLDVLWHKYNPDHTYHLFILAEKTTS